MSSTPHNRYVGSNGERNPIEVWKFNHQVRTVVAGTHLRIQANAPFLLHWTSDDWQHSADTRSRATGIGIEFADILLPQQQNAPVRFTFLWVEENRWEAKSTSWT